MKTSISTYSLHKYTIQYILDVFQFGDFFSIINIDGKSIKNLTMAPTEQER